MSKNRILILGAGLAGLSSAWHLQRKGIDCQVFEQEKEVGGLCRSKEINGFTFDYDGHLLHFKEPYAFNLAKSLLGTNMVKHKRNAYIYSHSCYTRYPFQANLNGLPASVIKECINSYLSINGKPKVQKKNQNFFDWANNSFGNGIARHFLLPYNKKFWTIKLNELTCEWLDGFIPIPSTKEIIEGSIKFTGKEFGYNSCFWYPKKGGISELPKAFASRIKNIHTSCKIRAIDLKEKKISLDSGAKEKFDYLISTIPLPELPNIIKPLNASILKQFKKLRWNSVYNLNLGLESASCNGHHWVYFPEKEFSFFRLGFPHNISQNATPSGMNSLYAEVSYSLDKPLDKCRIKEIIKNDLKKINVFTSDTKIKAKDVNDIKYAYPIYDANYSNSRERIITYLARNNIFSCGRYGSWRYLSMEGAILDGLNASRPIKS